MSSGLGAVQRSALVRLHDSPQGLTAPELADLSWGSSRVHRTTAVLNVLKLLRARGLVVTTGRVPRPPARGRGARAYRWVLTGVGRELAAGLGPDRAVKPEHGNV